jgi:enterochelin esterase-like enzyme
MRSAKKQPLNHIVRHFIVRNTAMKSITLAIPLVLLSLIGAPGCSVIASPAPTSTPTCAEYGHVERGGVESPTLGWAIDFEVYLPPCYAQHTWASYPVLYLIPGLHGAASAWNGAGAADIADRMIRAGEVPAFIMVTPANYPSDSQGDALMADLFPHIEERYRTLNDRTHRAVGGASMGGAIAYRMAFEHPILFSSVGVFGSGVVHGEEEAFAAWVAALPAEQRPRTLIDCGDEDTYMLGRARQMAEILAAQEMPYALNVGSGAHNYTYWVGNMEMYLRWYAEEW